MPTLPQRLQARPSHLPGYLRHRIATLILATLGAYLSIHTVNYGLYAVEPRVPNIVLILADDLGVEGLNCYGGTSYRTPRLDRLAAEGMRFTHAYAQPLCTNTRIQLMTGLYNHRNWLYFGCLDPRAKTFGHYLSKAGYKTCMVGKWQLQSYDPPDYPGGKHRRGKGMKVDDAGFHEYSLWHTGHTEDKGLSLRRSDDIRERQVSHRHEGPLWAGPLGEAYLEQVSQATEERPETFFCLLCDGTAALALRADTSQQRLGRRREAASAAGYHRRRHEVFCRHGRLRGRGRRTGRRRSRSSRLCVEETLILFYSDNGTDRRVTSQTIFGTVAGGKGTTTNAGTHVPLIARWPGRIGQGTINANLVDSTDFLPTLLEAAGRPVAPADGVSLDGTSFFGQLLDKPTKPRQWVFCHYDPRPGWDKEKYRLVRFARDRRFKLYADGRLFDIHADIREQHPIIDAEATPEARAARERLDAVLKSMRDPA